MSLQSVSKGWHHGSIINLSSLWMRRVLRAEGREVFLFCLSSIARPLPPLLAGEGEGGKGDEGEVGGFYVPTNLF